MNDFMSHSCNIAVIIMEYLYMKLDEAESHYQKACKQNVLLNNRFQALQIRYIKARQENHRSFIYTLRLRIATVEGIRNAYYEYGRGGCRDNILRIILQSVWIR